MIIDLYADTKRGFLGFGDFYIESRSDGWEWFHKDCLDNGVKGTCDTLFEALEAAHDAAEQMLSDKLDAMSGGKP